MLRGHSRARRAHLASRAALPEEVAAVARFCALEAPASMTGAVLDVNGASYVR